jgi:hypothetical protein
MPVLAAERAQIPANVNVLGNIPNAVCTDGSNSVADNCILFVTILADRGFDPGFIGQKKGLIYIPAFNKFYS